jgi:predicted secreted hydrolase
MNRSGFLRQCLPRGLGLLSGLDVLALGAANANTQSKILPPAGGALVKRQLNFPKDHGAHLDSRTEWWYLTGFVDAEGLANIGFQLTFFRSRTSHPQANPNRLAPQQLMFGHAAIAQEANGKLLHAQMAARSGSALHKIGVDDTDLQMQSWKLRRVANSNKGLLNYRAECKTTDFSLSFDLHAPHDQPVLQGEQGFSQKGPKPEQSSFYYSVPQLKVNGEVILKNKQHIVNNGTAWLDHEWSTTLLDPNAQGWDWVGVNFKDGSSLIAFRMRSKAGPALWNYLAWTRSDGSLIAKTQGPQALKFEESQMWKSPRSGANYPIAVAIYFIDLSGQSWSLSVMPLMPDQEIDGRASTGTIYWEGAVSARLNLPPNSRARSPSSQSVQPLTGNGYLELTGYHKPISF